MRSVLIEEQPPSRGVGSTQDLTHPVPPAHGTAAQAQEAVVVGTLQVTELQPNPLKQISRFMGLTNWKFKG